jgi:hypothetical protein
MSAVEQPKSPAICIEEGILKDARQEVATAIQFDFDTFKRVRRILGWSAEQIKMPGVIAFGGVVVEGKKNEADILPQYNVLQTSAGEAYCVHSPLPKLKYSSRDVPQLLICDPPAAWTGKELTKVVVDACLETPPEVHDGPLTTIAGISGLVGAVIGEYLQETADMDGMMFKVGALGLLLGAAVVSPSIPSLVKEIRRNREVALANKDYRRRSEHLSFFNVQPKWGELPAA